MLIAGNLDVEVTWARLDAAARRARGEKAFWPDDPRFALPEPVMWKISAAATLLRVFAESDADQLWTPRHVDPWRMGRVDWLAMPRLVTGPVPDAADLWWGEATEIAAQVNHRARIVELRTGEYDVPGQAVVRTIDELTAHAAATGSWIAKAPHSAAARSRVRGERGPLEEKARVQAERMLKLHGCLLFEPWFDRLGDLGVTGPDPPLRLAPASADGTPETAEEIGRKIDDFFARVKEAGVPKSDPNAPEIERQMMTLLAGSTVVEWFRPPHRLIVDGSGRFAGITTPLPANEWTHDLYRLTATVSKRLVGCGYHGPFGIDLFRVATPDGSDPLHISEVNARRTFGHVAHAFAAKARTALGLAPEEPVTLRFGRGAPPPDTIPLLLPAPDEDTCAWLEYGPGIGHDGARHAG